MKEYVSERGVRGNGLEWARRECMDRERWRLKSCAGRPRERLRRAVSKVSKGKVSKGRKGLGEGTDMGKMSGVCTRSEVGLWDK